MKNKKKTRNTIRCHHHLFVVAIISLHKFLIEIIKVEDKFADLCLSTDLQFHHKKFILCFRLIAYSYRQKIMCIKWMHNHDVYLKWIANLIGNRLWKKRSTFCVGNDFIFSVSCAIVCMKNYCAISLTHFVLTDSSISRLKIVQEPNSLWMFNGKLVLE